MKSTPLFVLLIFLATACHTEQKTTTDTTPVNFPLQNTYWELTNINCAPIGGAPDMPFIVFDGDGGFHGNLGCNSFFGNYTADDKKMSLSYKGSTKKLCSDMNLEKEFSKCLKEDLNNYVIVKDILIIRVKEREVLRFKAGAPKE